MSVKFFLNFFIYGQQLWELQMEDEWKITEAMPQLMVDSEKAFEAAGFYELLFGAQITRYNEFPMQSRTSDRYCRVACVELTIGSSPLVVRDFDSINSR